MSRRNQSLLTGRPVSKPSRPPRAKLRAEPETPLGASGKAFMLLELIAGARAPVSMADLVRMSGLTKPTAHRITSVLADMGFIERDMWKRGYIEGPRLIKLALATLAAAAPRTLRHAILQSVSEEVGETCNFGIMAGSEVIYLDRVEAKWPLGLRFEAGSRVPIHCTAIGKLLLSQMPGAERAEMLAALPLTRYTSRTITDRNRLNLALDLIRQSGVGTDDQEFMDGVVCVSVPVIIENGDVIGAVAVSAPEARASLDQIQKFVPVMREAAKRLAATFQLPPGPGSSG